MIQKPAKESSPQQIGVQCHTMRSIQVIVLHCDCGCLKQGLETTIRYVKKKKECQSHQDAVIGFVVNHTGIHSFRVNQITSKYGK